jgi:hypothetical protein
MKMARLIVNLEKPAEAQADAAVEAAIRTSDHG